MNKAFFTIVFIGLYFYSISQDKILSIGYSKNFVNKDSTNFSVTMDLNRVPGKTEAAGSYYPVNKPFFSTALDFYIKPTADVNLGSYTTSAPNNISVGLPIGLVYEFPKVQSGYFALGLEFSSDLVSDKKLDQYLYYFSPGVTFNYTFYDSSRFLNQIDFGIGAYYSSGTRMQDIKVKEKNKYNKFYLPVSLSFNLFKNAAKNFYRVKFSGIYKYNNVYNDDRTITTKKDRNYIVLKLDYFFVKQLGVNITYNAGYEEPLFKKVNALSFGITFAR
jgi:hypothetical protein